MKPRKNIECLMNPTREQVLERESFLAFPFYLSERNKNVLQLSDEILSNLELGFNDGRHINATIIGNALVSMWFRTSGAYEIVRIISQAKECFTAEFIVKITELKNQLAIVRIPSAKMVEQGKKSIPVNSNRSADGWDWDLKDLIVDSP